jgi:hypothetical protein
MAKDVDVAEQNRKGASRLVLGGWFGLLAAVLAVVLPIAFLEIGTYHPSGSLAVSSTLLQYSGTLVLAGAILYILALFVYRRSFSALRKADPEFWFASVLCLVGSVGFILIIVAAAFLTGTSSSLISCLHGQPSHALSCLDASQPFGAYSALVGFALAWIGGIGIVLGLSLAGARFERGAISGGAWIYLLFLLALLVPLIELAVRLPGIQYFLVVLPILAVAAPLLVLVGARETSRTLAGAT